MPGSDFTRHRRVAAGALTVVLVAVGPASGAVRLAQMSTSPLDPASIATAPAAATVRADLDVDTNRNGQIEDWADEELEDAPGATSGALFLANCDRDGTERIDAAAFDAEGRPAFESRGVESLHDVRDLAPLLVRATGAAAGIAWWLRMRADDARAVHVFEGRRQGAALLMGGFDAASKAPGEIVAVPLLGVSEKSDLELAIESLYLPGHKSGRGKQEWEFDGEVELELVATLTGSSTPIATDRVRLQVAPFLLVPPTQPARRIWMQSNDGSAALADAFGGVAGLVEQDPADAAMYRFFQDHVEIGFAAMPDAGGAGWHGMHIALQTPLVPLPAWPGRELLAPDRGVYRWRAPATGVATNACDMGGNLELIPPSPAWPLGRVLIGAGMSDDFLSFLRAQRIGGAAVQGPVLVDLGWLRVGHVDEIVNFLPTPEPRAVGARPFKVVIAQPGYALQLLREGDPRRGLPAPADDTAAFVIGPQAAGRASNALRTTSSALLFDGVAHGSIHCPSAAALRDGETVSVHDGKRRLVFEFDFDAATTPDNVAVALKRNDVAADVSARLSAAIVENLNLVVALSEADGTFILANREFGTQGNQPIIEAVANERLVVRGMVGGEAESHGRDFTKQDWRIVRIFDGQGKGQIASVTHRYKGFLNIYSPKHSNSVFQTASMVADREAGFGNGLQHLLYGALTGAEASDRWIVEPGGDSAYIVATEALTWHTRGPTGAYGFPTMVSISELKHDASLAALNDSAQRNIDRVRAAIIDAMGETGGHPFLRDDGEPGDDSLCGDLDDDFIRLPVLFAGVLAADGSIQPRSAEALAPNLVNFQASDPAHVVFPRTHFGPGVEVSGLDLFERAARLAVGEGAQFIDEWLTYHDRVGEVHCATAAEREPPATTWWDPLPGGSR